MKKIFLSSFLFAVSALGLHAQRLLHNELLGRPTDNSVTVQLIFADSVQMSIQYGTATGNYTSQTPWQPFSANEPAELVLTGLQANTKYFYRVRYRVPGSSSSTNRPEYTFHTQRPIGSSFSFIVEADPHLDEQSDSALYRLCLENQLSDNPDFMIDPLTLLEKL